MVHQLGNGELIRAERTMGIASQAYLAELHGKGIVSQQCVSQEIAQAQDILDRLSGLQGANHAGQNPQYTGLGTRGHDMRRRRRTKNTTIAGRFPRNNGHQLAVKTQDTGMDQGLFCKETGVIDQELGGTTPLDVILTLMDQNNTAVSVPEIQEDIEEEDSFEEEFNDVADQEQYWFTDEKINIIKKVHNYLTHVDQIGEVQSFATLLDTGKILNENKDLDSIDLALIYQKLPQKYRDIILSPYVNIEHNQLRFATRIVDSNEALRRDALLKTIKNELSQTIDPGIATVQLSNLMVLYNNMLQSLFHSQITMIGLVLLIIFFMFFILFRTLKLTLIALIVNVIPIGMVFGFMGWLNIPLDIMTITIAAIALGIGVDDTIHYIHRFKVEFAKDNFYYFTMHRTNTSIGNAMYYTSLTVIIGFSILTLSNLIPTIYFGILTVLVMAAALVSNLILLPKLLLLVKPLKKSNTI